VIKLETKQFVPNSNLESVKEEILRQIKPSEIQIAQNHFNSKTTS